MLRQFFLFLLIGIAFGRKEPFYRKDYTYFDSFDAFYKFHWKQGTSSWLDAFTKCGNEGASLFYPSIDGEYSVVTNLREKAPTYDGGDIFIGIHDLFNVGEFITIDGSSPPYPIPDNDIGPYSNNRCVSLSVIQEEYKAENCTSKTKDLQNANRGFICKKTIDTAICPTVDKDYSYSEKTGYCYKVHNLPKSWYEAYENCYMEGGSIFVPDNEKEYDEVYALYVRPNNAQINEEHSYFIGAKRPMTGGEVFTVKGVPMVKESYQVWQNAAATLTPVPSYSDNLDNYSDQSDAIPWIRPPRDCVALTYQYVNDRGNLYCFSTESCNEKLRFICKMKANRV